MFHAPWIAEYEWEIRMGRGIKIKTQLFFKCFSHSEQVNIRSNLIYYDKQDVLLYDLNFQNFRKYFMITNSSCVMI